MLDGSLEEIVPETEFARVLGPRSEALFRFANSHVAEAAAGFGKGELIRLVNLADALESFLDDHGARYNQTFHDFTELVASTRGIALARFSVAHLRSRLADYGAKESMEIKEAQELEAAISETDLFLAGATGNLLAAARQEASERGVSVTAECEPQGPEWSGGNGGADLFRRRLPRNVGQTEPENEEQKVAEVVSKYLQASAMLEDVSIRKINAEDDREKFLRRACTEEQARVYEATVHNLQSAYDTHIKNTVLEREDERLGRLRGHISTALHLLEAVTQLVHFVERHESGVRSDRAEERITHLVPRSEVRELTLNALLFWANRTMQSGRGLAEDLLPSYTNVQILEVELPAEVELHARPAALIVGIVNRYGTPVELEVAGTRCNAGSILELMITIGSNADARRFRFRGDETPLADIARLFGCGLGESGLEDLPPELSYLRG
ncbi:MAG: HPr family phosphocarrier protein [Planctomycetota bacterium]|jgi:phosphotransferase system HPr (HPr) family protein|nr:HPr family phosphocarrier protein [Planctomycetota bacterium]MDP6520964.1 HPr family phosphocarrier protein [Planctomycetota bacterium]MDP6838187.1 HPr family phosphocarrier protein [Planctomycetota bacterium]MDP6957030.1 HPr family phosphocarrier protein [Planctomycetota bacterium]